MREPSIAGQVCRRRRPRPTADPLATLLPPAPSALAAASSAALAIVIPFSPNPAPKRPRPDPAFLDRPVQLVARSLGSFETALAALLRHDSVKYLVAGAAAGVVSRTVVSPLEVVATTAMCTVGQKSGLITELQTLFAREGMRGFFKGNAANCLKVAPTKGIQFLTFEAFKRLIHRRKDAAYARANSHAPLKEIPLSPLERLTAGGGAGMTAALVCYPLEVAKTLLTAHPETYRGVFATIRSVARQNGVRALYRGITPTLVAMFPYVGLEFMVYEQLKLLYLERQSRIAQARGTRDRAAASTLVLLMMGAVAGSVAQTVCHPLDVIRKRLQLQGIGGRPEQYRSILHTARSIVSQEGAPSLYRGLQPTYMSVLPSAGVSYVVYEAVKNILHVRSIN